MSITTGYRLGHDSLSKVERLMLANQFRILAHINPGEASGYTRWAEALEHGFELHFDDAFVHISDTFPRERCKWVLDVLDMHRMMWYAWQDSGSDSEISKSDVLFWGFDGNNESEYLCYVNFYMSEDNVYEELKENRPSSSTRFNSHMPTLATYERMLKAWKKSDNPYDLTKSDLKRIVQSRYAG